MRQVSFDTVSLDVALSSCIYVNWKKVKLNSMRLRRRAVAAVAAAGAA